jgi:predicted transposase/invertase (TIGR01784 family)
MAKINRDEYISQLRERWNNMTITSDPMFGLVMENKKICLQLIQRALPHLAIKELADITTQKEIRAVAARNIVYDVYVKDHAGRVFIIEMQMADQHNLPYRLRYYLGQADQELLNPTDDYRILAKYPTYALMFCNFDYFGRGWARYEFKMACTRDPHLLFGDDRTVTIFNAKAKSFLKDDEPIKSFLALMRNHVDNKSRFINNIQDEVSRIKHNPERRRSFMKFETLLADARYDGRQEGLKEGIQNFIQSLRELDIPDQVIKQKLVEHYHLSEAEAADSLNK